MNFYKTKERKRIRIRLKKVATISLCATVFTCSAIPCFADDENVDTDVYIHNGEYEEVSVAQSEGGSSSTNGTGNSDSNSSSGTSTNRSSSQSRNTVIPQEVKDVIEAKDNILNIFRDVLNNNKGTPSPAFGSGTINSVDIYSIGVDTIDAESVNVIKDSLETLDNYTNDGLVSEAYRNNDIAVTYPETSQSISQLTPAQLEEAKRKIAAKENIPLGDSKTGTITFGDSQKRILIRTADNIFTSISNLSDAIVNRVLQQANRDAEEYTGLNNTPTRGTRTITLADLWQGGIYEPSTYGAPISFPDSTIHTPGTYGNVVWGIRNDLIRGGMRDSTSYIDRFKGLSRFGYSNYMSDDLNVAVLMDCHITDVRNEERETRIEDSQIRYWQAYYRDTGQPYGDLKMTTDPKRDFVWRVNEPGVFVLKEYIPVTYITDFKVDYLRTNYIIDADSRYILYFNNSTGSVSLGRTEVSTTEASGLEYVVRVNEYGQIENNSNTQRVK